MATLSINGKQVTVDDSFLKLSPDQQNATVDEIAGQMGISAAPPQSPAPLPNAQQRYDSALAQVRKQQFPNMSDQQWAAYSKATLAPYNANDLLQQGATLGWGDEIGSGIGALGSQVRQSLGGGGQGFGDAYNTFEALEQARRDLGRQQQGGLGAAAEVVGGLASLGPERSLAASVANNAPRFAQTTAPLWQTMLKGGVTGAGLGAAADAGATDRDKLQGVENGALTGGVIGAAAPALFAGIGRTAQAGADAVNGFRQARVTNASIAGAPTSQQMKDAASQAFDASVGNNPPILTNNAYGRLMGSIQGATQKFRPNDLKTPQAVGLLKHIWQIGDEINAPGSNAAADLKDLHILRQGANDLYTSGANNETKMIGKTIVGQIDNFVTSLKPADIAGASDPSQAAKSLMQGIAGWQRASKVKIIEDAVGRADGYASGFQNGLQRQFKLLVKGNDFRRFSAAEQQAIRTVANGTPKSNALNALGKLGFKFGGGTGNNIIGGTIGNAALTGALTPFLGPAAAPVSMGTTTLVGGMARKAGEDAALGQANRAAQIVATPNIPSVPPWLLQKLSLNGIAGPLGGAGGLVQGSSK